MNCCRGGGRWRSPPLQVYPYAIMWDASWNPQWSHPRCCACIHKTHATKVCLLRCQTPQRNGCPCTPLRSLTTGALSHEGNRHTITRTKICMMDPFHKLHGVQKCIIMIHEHGRWRFFHELILLLIWRNVNLTHGSFKLNYSVYLPVAETLSCCRTSLSASSIWIHSTQRSYFSHCSAAETRWQNL